MSQERPDPPPAGQKRKALRSPGKDFHCGIFQKLTIEAVRDLQGTLQKSRSVDETLKALENLQGYVVDEQVLRATSIGREVNQIVKDEQADPEAREMAQTLKTRWKRDYDIRKKVVETFQEKGLTTEMAREMEVNLFNAATPYGLLEGEHYRSYQHHFKRLCTHLRTKGEGSVSERLAEGTISPREVAWLPDAQLLSMEQLQKEQMHKEEGLQAALATQTEPEGIPSDEFTCPKCQGSRTVYTEKVTAWHTDGQDPTVIVTCLNCNERWRASDDHGLAG